MHKVASAALIHVYRYPVCDVASFLQNIYELLVKTENQSQIEHSSKIEIKKSAKY